MFKQAALMLENIQGFTDVIIINNPVKTMALSIHHYVNHMIRQGASKTNLRSTWYCTQPFVSVLFTW